MGVLGIGNFLSYYGTQVNFPTNYLNFYCKIIIFFLQVGAAKLGVLGIDNFLLY